MDLLLLTYLDEKRFPSATTEELTMDDKQLTPHQRRVEALKLTYVEYSRIQEARRMLQRIDDIIPEGTNVRHRFESVVDDLLHMERYGYRDACTRKQTAVAKISETKMRCDRIDHPAS